MLLFKTYLSITRGKRQQHKNDKLRIITPTWNHEFKLPDTSQQMLVPRMSRARPPPTSPRSSLEILYDHPGDLPICRSGDVPTWRPRNVWNNVMGRPNLTFKGRCWKVDSGRPQDVLRTSPWMSENFFSLFLRSLFDWPNLSKSNSTLKMYWEPSPTSEMEHFLRN